MLVTAVEDTNMTLKQIFFATACCCLTASQAIAQSESLSDYDCQVTTATGLRGLVQVTALTEKSAIKMSQFASAYTERSTREEATDVIECVNRTREEKFSDFRFEWWSMNEVYR